MNWYVDGGLQVLIVWMKNRYAGLVVGTIGDQAHQNEHSDHNPEADGSVDAGDFMLNRSFTFAEAQLFADALVRSRDTRIAYIIWNRRICSSTGAHAWEWRTYSGTDPHTGHVHLSVNDLHENDKSPWDLQIGKKAVVVSSVISVRVPDIGEGDSDDNIVWPAKIITRMQRIFGITDDGVWGPQTTKAAGGKRMTEKIYRTVFGLS